MNEFRGNTNFIVYHLKEIVFGYGKNFCIFDYDR